MYLLGVFTIINLSLIPLSEGTLWALLVAGSFGYSNYRHQANTCHAYHILRQHGVPSKNIITMMFDDIAYNSQNPTQGVIINQPGGKNVYDGIRGNIDYRDVTVTPENFINVLVGDKAAMKNIGSGNVIESGPDDIIFVSFSDHGAPGYLCFPMDPLTVRDLNNVLVYLSTRQRFKKLILYIEACYAGSMFDNILADDINIFVMTASDPFESAFPCYWDDIRRTYLSDYFSASWMQESQKENLKNHSLHHLYEIVRTKTNTESHAEEYGDLDIGNTSLADIFWSFNVTKTKSFDIYREDIKKAAVNAIDVPIQILTKKLEKLEESHAKDEALYVRSQIKTILQNRHYLENVMNDLVIQMAGNSIVSSSQLQNKKAPITKRNIDCYDTVVKEFSNTCFNIAKNPFVATQIHILINACDLFNYDGSKIINDIRQVCQKLEPMTNIV